MQRSTIVLLFILASFPTLQAAISPLSLLGPNSSPQLERLDDLRAEQLVRTNRALSAQEIARLQSDSWQGYLDYTIAIAPKPDVSNPLPPVMPQRVQGLPPTLLETGRRFREIKAIVSERPEFALEAFEFFSQCLENREIIETINTLCLGHAWDLSKRFDLPFEIEQYPKKWREIASLTIMP